MTDHVILPQQLVAEVEGWVQDRLAAAEGRGADEQLAEDGVYTLHRLAAEIYASGYDDGRRAQDERARGRARRLMACQLSAPEVEQMCDWHSNYAGARDTEPDHGLYHFGNPCPYEAVAAVMVGEPDPRREGKQP